MNAKVNLIVRRHVKYWFVRMRLHRLTQFLLGIFQHVVYLSLFSKWCNAHRNLAFTDFRMPVLNPNKRYELFEFLLRNESLDGEIDYLEFGVGSGASFKWWVENNENMSSRFIGFDSFKGLPEDWGILKKGAFATQSLPDLKDERCSFQIGMFQDTLWNFVNNFSFNRKTVIHLDADLYSSTLFVLTTLGPKLKKGDIIIFDEFGVPTHEFRAFLDFTSSYRVRYEVLGETNNYFQVAMRIL